MSNEIANVEGGGEIVSLEDLQQNNAVSKYGDEAFDALRTSTYLPRLQLMTANAEKCKKGEFPTNHYAIVDGKTFHDLGKSVDALVLGWRPKALEIDDEILTVYNPQDAEFARIQDRADNEKDSGCMWGFEFLLWIGGSQKFATFFCGSKSSRREAPSIKALMNKAVTLRSKYIETKKYSWYTPDAVECSTPMQMPTRGSLMAELDKFNNPPESSVEKAEDEDRSV